MFIYRNYISSGYIFQYKKRVPPEDSTFLNFIAVLFSQGLHCGDFRHRFCISYHMQKFYPFPQISVTLFLLQSHMFATVPKPILWLGEDFGESGELLSQAAPAFPS